MRIELSDHVLARSHYPRFVVYAETPAERAVLQAFVRLPIDSIQTDSKDAVELRIGGWGYNSNLGGVVSFNFGFVPKRAAARRAIKDILLGAWRSKVLRHA